LNNATIIKYLTTYFASIQSTQLISLASNTLPINRIGYFCKPKPAKKEDSVLGKAFNRRLEIFV